MKAGLTSVKILLSKFVILKAYNLTLTHCQMSKAYNINISIKLVSH